jgi:hypothetical protein
MKLLFRLMICGASVLVGGSGQTTLLWKWSYSAPGIAASGTFTTTNAADRQGFYRIVGITGSRNGVAISGLQATGTPIPGNAPFNVDNLISRSGHQLTVHGFGYAMANRDFANPFFDSAYSEFHSTPPYTAGGGTEVQVQFTASVVSRPGADLLVVPGLLGLVAVLRVRARVDRKR